MKQTSQTYVSEVLRTDCPITPELIERISSPQTVRLLHAAMGMVTEAAELVDMLKKHLFYGRELDTVNAKEELGDNQWYVGLAIDVLQTTMDDILTMNIDKLKLRYPEKFTEADAVGRDVDAERAFLEQQEFNETSRQVSAAAASAPKLSQRGRDWQEFSAKVLNHIEEYTVPQYGDAPNDLAETWTPRQSLDCVDRYTRRYGKNSREGQQELDFLKMAHYIQLAALKHELEVSL